MYLYVLNDISIIGDDRPTLKFLNRHVGHKIAVKWHDIGVQLLDAKCIENIKTNHPGDSFRCTMEMFRSWLEAPSATWNQLIKTLKEPDVRLEALALDLEGMLLKDVLEGAYNYLCNVQIQIRCFLKACHYK